MFIDYTTERVFSVSTPQAEYHCPQCGKSLMMNGSIIFCSCLTVHGLQAIPVMQHQTKPAQA